MDVSGVYQCTTMVRGGGGVLHAYIWLRELQMYNL